MPTLIVKDDEEILFASSDDSLKLVKLILDLKEKNIDYKAFEVEVNSRDFTVNKDNKREIELVVDDNIDLSDTIKCTSFATRYITSLKKLHIYTNSKKRISPLKIMEEYKEKLKELELTKVVDIIFSSWSKKFNYKGTNIYEDNSSWFKFENNEWVKNTSKKRRHF